MRKEPEARIEVVEDGDDNVAIYVVMDGVRIAQRGEPGSVYAGQWIPIELGWVVKDGKGGVRGGRMTIEYQGAEVQ